MIIYCLSRRYILHSNHFANYFSLNMIRLMWFVNNFALEMERKPLIRMQKMCKLNIFPHKITQTLETTLFFFAVSLIHSFAPTPQARCYLFITHFRN